MAFVKVGPVSALADGDVMETNVDGRPYAVCNAGGEVHCLDGESPCTGGPLSQGAIRHELLVCPWHGRPFDYKTRVSASDTSTKTASSPAKSQAAALSPTPPPR